MTTATPPQTPPKSTTPRACDHHAFPLFVHKGQWCAKINYKHRYFGAITIDPGGEKAWERHKRELPFWKAGMNPREMAKQQQKIEIRRTFSQIAGKWLEQRHELVNADDPDERIVLRTFDDSKYAVRAMALALKAAGLHPDQDPLGWGRPKWKEIRAQLGKVTIRRSDSSDLSPATKGGRIVAMHMMFKYAVDEGMLAKLPDWGDNFSTVSEDTKEEFRYDFQREHGDRVFDLPLARRLLEATDNAVARAGLNQNNTTGHRGVSKRPNGTYEAHIVLRRGGVKTKKYLGVFPTAEEAAEAYRTAANEKGIDVQRRMVIGAHLFCACCHLACNTGPYSKDIASLQIEDLELDRQYLERKRSKNCELWQAVLWPETCARIEAYLEVRPQPDRKHKQYHPEWDNLVFLSSTGLPINLDTPRYDARGQYTHTNRKDILKAQMRKMLDDLGEKVKGLNFGAWRHTFESLASSAIGCTVDDLKKFDALNRMGARRIPGSRNRYVKLRWEQLKPIGDTIREQLWPDRVRAERGAAAIEDELEQRQEKTKRLVREFGESAQHLRLVR